MLLLSSTTVMVIAQWAFLERVVQLSSASVNSATMKILHEERERERLVVITQSSHIYMNMNSATTTKAHFAHLDVRQLILVVLFELHEK